MYFVLSKLLWTLTAPSNVIALIIAAGVVVSATRFRRIGGAISAIGAFLLLLCGFGPADVWLLRPLEDRFERPANLTPPMASSCWEEASARPCSNIAGSWRLAAGD